jgi:hypothetical protein
VAGCDNVLVNPVFVFFRRDICVGTLGLLVGQAFLPVYLVSWPSSNGKLKNDKWEIFCWLAAVVDLLSWTDRNVCPTLQTSSESELNDRHLGTYG